MEEEKEMSLKLRLEGARELDLVRGERVGFDGVRVKVVLAIFGSVFVLGEDRQCTVL